MSENNESEGVGGDQVMQYLDDTKLGKKVLEQVPAETTDGEGRISRKWK